MSTHDRRLGIALLLLFLGLAVYLYAPGLFQNKSPVFGDSIVHGLPLFDFHSRVLHQGQPALWSDKIYGGHALHAEGQGAFAHPLNIAVAALFDPLLGQNVFHFICIVLSALGVYGLCRCHGSSVPAAVFSMFAVAFSTLWLKTQANITVSGTILWIPWTIWAMEHWYKAPSLRRAAIFGAATSLMVLAGYPHAFHGTLIFMGTTLLCELFSRKQRDYMAWRWRPIVLTGGAAVLLCAGLSAVQWLPLLELVGYSQRQQGITIANAFPADWTYRGLLYTLAAVNSSTPSAPSTGSLLVCVIASLCLVVKLPARAKCYIPATLVLLLLGMGRESMLMRLLYDYHLVPGMHFFRIMYIYLYLAVVGMAVLAALSLDSLGDRFHSASSLLPERYRWPIAMALALFWLAACLQLHSGDVPLVQYLLVALFLLAAAICCHLQRRILIATIAVLLIAFECAMLRIHPFHFADNSLLGQPASITALQADGHNLRDYKFKNTTAASAYTFMNPNSPDIERGVSTMLEAVAASSNMMWDIASPNGTFGLPSARLEMIESTIMAELNSGRDSSPGARLIDLLGYRYISTRNAFSAQGLDIVYRNPETGILVQENRHARPRIQVFSEAVVVDTPEQALATLLQLQRPGLVVEAGHKTHLPRSTAAQEIQFEAQLIAPDNYLLNIEAPTGGWLFISDANYPGWRAHIDDNEVAVWSAQVLGKAIYIPAGAKQLRVFFKSTSFTIGLWASSISLLLLLAMLLRRPDPAIAARPATP